MNGIRDKFKEATADLKEAQAASGAPASGMGKAQASDPQQKVRILENKLDKAMINLNEAQSIRKTYDIILRGLKEERVSYDL